jgi:uncharacterized membrane protein
MSEQRFPLRTLLFVSVAINLVVIGAAIGVAVSGARLHRGVAPPGVGPGPRAFMGALPPEKVEEIRQRLTAAWQANAPERDAARAARLEVFRLVSQDKFDEPGVRAAMAQVRAADARLTEKNQDALIVVLKDLDPRQRVVALGAILRGRGGHAFGEGRHGHGMRDRSLGEEPARDVSGAAPPGLAPPRAGPPAAPAP